jgi:hypothetical protein
MSELADCGSLILLGRGQNECEQTKSAKKCGLRAPALPFYDFANRWIQREIYYPSSLCAFASLREILVSCSRG